MQHLVGYLAVVLVLGTFPNGSVEARQGESLPRLRVSGTSLCTTDGKPVVLWGVNYFRPGTGWAPQLWRQFDPQATEKDLRLLRSYGVNCVRIFLTFGSFFDDPNRLTEEGLRKWDTFLDIAERVGIYVHPTGPDHWEGIPAWARRDRFADDEMLAAQERFWELFARHNRGRAVVVAYDLLNEPSVGWDSPALKTKWNRWLEKRYGSARALADAWGVPVTELPWGNISPPPSDGSGPRTALMDYQDFRETVAEEWTRRQAEAIRRADPEAMVTVGLIQWSVPVVLPGPRQYSAFRPERLSRWLDFQEIHFYPLARGFFDYRRREDWAENLAYVQAVVRECARTGQPVVVAEFGWYGGGKLTFGNHPPATEEDQARWCSGLVNFTRGLATGWLNWGVFDHPEARDVTQLTGLFRVDGTPKAWAVRFRQLSQELAAGSLAAIKVPDIPFNWTEARIDPAVGRRFLESYTDALRQMNAFAPLDSL